ncbi:MAG: PepSY domain-containing protein [Hyphomicrobiales bacterium]|nr:MAG: PepSY domain-containing protein [Hyphomicrobiales bacterium]
MQLKPLLTAAALTLTLVGTAQASDDDKMGNAKCGNTSGQWMSVEAAKGKAAEMGLQVRRIKREDGCYELYAINAEGRRQELYMNPVSGKIVKSKSKS